MKLVALVLSALAYVILLCMGVYVLDVSSVHPVLEVMAIVIEVPIIVSFFVFPLIGNYDEPPILGIPTFTIYLEKLGLWTTYKPLTRSLLLSALAWALIALVWVVFDGWLALVVWALAGTFSILVMQITKKRVSCHFPGIDPIKVLQWRIIQGLYHEFPNNKTIWNMYMRADDNVFPGWADQPGEGG